MENAINNRGDGPLFVSFFTRHSIYEKDAGELVESLKSFNLPYHVEAIADRGNWAANTAYKPRFILERALQYPGRSLIWIDCDARIRQEPSLFWQFFKEGAPDVAAHIRPRNQELLTGTLYLKGDTCLRLLRSWVYRAEERPQIWEQKHLQDLLPLETAKGLKFQALPASYCMIFDLMRKTVKPEEIVIEHLQTSREARKEEAPHRALRSLMADNQKRAILEALPAQGTLLEWGGGGSTRHFLEHLGPQERLITVEHKAAWVEAIKRDCKTLAKSRTPHDILLREPEGAEPGKNATYWEESPAGLEAYILPLGLPEMRTVDVFLVDGIARGACLAGVLLYGKPGAKVFLHDAGRPWYNWAVNLGLESGRLFATWTVTAEAGGYPPLLWGGELS